MNEDIVRETVFIPRGWRWEPSTIYQLRSHHPGWDSLRAILDEGSIYQLVGDESRVEDGIAAIGKLHPEAILFGADLPDVSAVELTTELRAVSPASKLVVVGEEPEDELLVQLGEMGVDAVLPWRRVTPLGVFCCLMPVLQNGWRVGTTGAVPGLWSGPVQGSKIMRWSLAWDCSTWPHSAATMAATGQKPGRILAVLSLSDDSHESSVEVCPMVHQIPRR